MWRGGDGGGGRGWGLELVYWFQLLPPSSDQNNDLSQVTKIESQVKIYDKKWRGLSTETPYYDTWRDMGCQKTHWSPKAKENHQLNRKRLSNSRCSFSIVCIAFNGLSFRTK